MFEAAQERKALLEEEISARRQQLHDCQMQVKDESLQLARNGAYCSFLQRNCKLVKKEVDVDMRLCDETKEDIESFFELSKTFGDDFEVMKQELVALCKHRDMLKKSVSILQEASQKRKADQRQISIQHSGLVKELGQLEQECIDQTSLVAQTQAALATLHDDKQAADSRNAAITNQVVSQLQALRASEEDTQRYNAERAIGMENQQNEAEGYQREVVEGKGQLETIKTTMSQAASSIQEASITGSHLMRDFNEARAENEKLVNSDKETRAATASIKKRLVETQEIRARVEREHQELSQALVTAETKEREQEKMLDQTHSSVDAEKEDLAKGMQEHSELSAALPISHAQLHHVQKGYHADLDKANNDRRIAQALHSATTLTLAKVNEEVALLNQRVEASSKELAEMQAQKVEGQRKIDELQKQLLAKMTDKIEVDISTKHKQASKLEEERMVLLAKMSSSERSVSEDGDAGTTSSIISQVIADKQTKQEAEFKQSSAHEFHEIQAKIDEIKASEHIEQANAKHRKKVEALQKAISEAKSLQRQRQSQGQGQGQRTKSTVKPTGKPPASAPPPSQRPARSLATLSDDTDHKGYECDAEADDGESDSLSYRRPAPLQRNGGKTTNPAREGPKLSQHPAARSVRYSTTTSAIAPASASAAAAMRTFSVNPRGLTKKPPATRMVKSSPGDDWFTDDAVWGRG